MYDTSKRLSMPLLYSGIWLFGPPWGPEGVENIGKSSYLNLPHIGFTLFSPIKGRIYSLTVYIYKAEILFLEPSVCQKNTKNQYAVLPGISLRVLASHFSSVIGNFRSSGCILTYRRTLVLHYLLQSRGV
jgi:hypothetical protein